MIDQFKAYISVQKLFLKKDKIILTVSGGIDSVVMADLFFHSGFNFAIAHCNFQLRGEESNADEFFVKKIAEKYKVPFFINRFKTSEYADKEKISIQMAARELRYNWFEKLLKEQGYNYIATAHHQNDQIETFFINLLRGTGIAGLHGILPKQGNIIRPLLFATRNLIEVYAKENNIIFREDSSNSSLKYQRNYIRHNILTHFKSISPDFEKVMFENIDKIYQAEQVMNQYIEIKKSELIQIEKNGIFINIKKLKELSPLKIFMYHILNQYGFNNEVIDNLIPILDTTSGKQFFSSTHRLVKDRELLIIAQINSNTDEIDELLIFEETNRIKSPISIDFRITKENEILKINTDRNWAYLDFDKLKFPLVLRKWRKGDFFIPFGMKGKKKISDFFVDQKLSLIEKEQTWLLCSNDDIVWIVGHRIDDRYKLTNQSRKGFIAVHYE